MRTLLVLPLAVGLALVLLDGCVTTYGIGTRTITLEFLVLDSETKRPIAGALVELREEGTPTPLQQATTDASGRARIVRDFPLITTDGALFSHSEGIEYFEEVHVAGLSYEPYLEYLGQLTGEPAYHHSTTPPPIRLELHKPTSP